MIYRLDELEINILKDVFKKMVFEKDAIFQDMFDEGIKEEELLFLKNTRLGQIKIEDNSEDNSTFFIINEEKNTRIAVSNRISTNNELRGQILKARLTAEENSPTKTIYDLLTQNNPNIFTNVLIIYLNNGLKESYPLNFIQLVEYLIYEQVKNKTDIATFWSGIDFEAIFERANRLLPILEYLENDTTQQSADLHANIERANQIYLQRATQLSNYPFIDALIQLQVHTSLLNAEGYVEASNSLQDIYNKLIAKFVNSNEDPNQFKNNCLAILNTNNYPELKVHHHLVKKALSILMQLFNFLSFGLIPQYKTESERMVMSLFNGLNSMPTEPQASKHSMR